MSEFDSNAVNGATGAESEAPRTPAPSELHVCGVNHELVGLDIRERFALDAEACARALHKISGGDLAREAMILSTCNRTEIYIYAQEDAPLGARLESLFFSLAESPLAAAPPIYRHSGLEAARHFFAVNSGLNSMILGENEIKAQVRRAFEISRATGMAGPRLHRLVEWANRCAKRIKTETDLNAGTLCYGRVAVMKAEEALGGLGGKTCMVIGAGKIGRSAAMALAERRPARLIVANRTPERAEEVARGLGAQVVSVAEMARVLPECDLALGAAFAPHFLVTRAMFEAVRASAPARPVCLIDAAVPRILDRAIGELPGVTLFDLGDLEEIIARHRDRRAAAAQEAWAIVESEVEKYRRAVRSMELGPWIDLLRQRFDSAATEVESGANSLDSDRRLKQRLLHEAIAVLKELHGDDRTRIG